MNCYQHEEAAAVAFCRTCGQPLCEQCKREARGTIFCQEHLPPPKPEPSPYDLPPAATPTVPGQASPGLAFFLGLIPGVGAIYNGQYAKGLVHALIFGFLITLISSDAAPGLEPLFGVLQAAFIFYMAFEAYHTAAKRNRGEVVDEFSSLVNRRTPAQSNAGAITLIALGVIFLLNTMELVQMRQILKYWPVLLIALGANMLYTRLSAKPADHPTDVSAIPSPEVRDERQ